jgi:cell wall assembly regulator SMI1
MCDVAQMSAGDDTRAALARLEDAMRRTRHPLVEALQPGLPPDEVRERVAALGVALPDDAVALWAWHDGFDPAFTKSERVPGAEFMPGGVLFLRLARAEEDYGWMLETYPVSDIDDWSPKWFPAFASDNGDTVYLDCSTTPATGPTPLQLRYMKDYNPPEVLARNRIGSIDWGIDVMTALVERGIWALNPQFIGYGFVRDADPDLDARWLG